MSDINLQNQHHTVNRISMIFYVYHEFKDDIQLLKLKMTMSDINQRY